MWCLQSVRKKSIFSWNSCARGAGFVLDLHALETKTNTTGSVPFIYLYPRRFLFHFYFFIPLIALALLSRSLPVVVAQIRGHQAGPPPPIPATVRAAFIFIARITQHFSSLFVDSRRIGLLPITTLLSILSS